MALQRFNSTSKAGVSQVNLSAARPCQQTWCWGCFVNELSWIPEEVEGALWLLCEPGGLRCLLNWPGIVMLWRILWWCCSGSSGSAFSKLPLGDNCPAIPKKGENGNFTPKIYAHKLCATLTQSYSKSRAVIWCWQLLLLDIDSHSIFWEQPRLGPRWCHLKNPKLLLSCSLWAPKLVEMGSHSQIKHRVPLWMSDNHLIAWLKAAQGWSWFYPFIPVTSWDVCSGFK